MRLHAVGNEHKDRNHDLAGSEINLARIKYGMAEHPEGLRPVEVSDTGLDAISIGWVQEIEKAIGKGNYAFTLELTYADIAKLFCEAFGEQPFSVAAKALASAARGKGKAR